MDVLWPGLAVMRDSDLPHMPCAILPCAIPVPVMDALWVALVGGMNGVIVFSILEMCL